MKLAIVVGTRPEIIRLSAIINKAREIAIVVNPAQPQNLFSVNKFVSIDCS